MPGYLGDEDYFKSKYSKYFNTSLLKTAAKDMIISSEQGDQRIVFSLLNLYR